MDTNQQVAQFNPSTIMDGVRDKIKASFIELIPEEHWNAMVQKEIDDYFSENINVNTNNYDKSNFKSKFQILLRSELESECKLRLADYLKSSEFNASWGVNGQMVASQATKTMMIENSGAIMANMFSGMFSGMLSNFEMTRRNNNPGLRY